MKTRNSGAGRPSKGRNTKSTPSKGRAAPKRTRPGDSPARAERSSGDRPYSKTFTKSGGPARRPSRDDRPERPMRDRAERPARDRDERPARDFGERPVRAERPERSDRPSSFSKRPAARGGEERSFSSRRPSSSRDERPSRDRDERPARTERYGEAPRGDRPASFSKRPAARGGEERSFSSRRPSSSRDERPSRDRDERPARTERYGEAPRGDRPFRAGASKRPAGRRDDDRPAFGRGTAAPSRRPSSRDTKNDKHPEKRPFKGRGEVRAPIIKERREKPVAAEVPATVSSTKAQNMLYGFHAVRQAWLNPERDCRRLLLTDGGAELFDSVIDEARELELNRPGFEPVDRDYLDKLLPGAVHQGIALDATPLDEVDVASIVTAAANNPHAIVVILDQVTDPHNVGAIMRSAAAFGAMALIMPERNAPPTTGVLAKIACGAADVIPLIRVGNLARAIDDLKAGGFWTVGLDEKGKDTLAACDLSGKVALVMGAEGDGMRRLTTERCDLMARLPTQMPIGSLNVSNAAAVALYEVTRARSLVKPE